MSSKLCVKKVSVEMSKFDEIADIVVDVCDVNRELILPETNLIDELEVDSLDFLDVTYDIFKKYDVRLPVEDWMIAINEGTASLEDFFVMSKLVGHIEALVAAAQAE